MITTSDKDLLWDDNGDLVIEYNSKTGELDLADTARYPGMAQLQVIRECLTSEKGEWALEPNVGANLSSRVLGSVGSDNQKVALNQAKAQAMYNIKSLIAIDNSRFNITPLRIYPNIIIFNVTISTANANLSMRLAFNQKLRTGMRIR